MISSTLYIPLMQLNYHFPYPLFKSDWFAKEYIVLFFPLIFYYNLGFVSRKVCSGIQDEV